MEMNIVAKYINCLADFCGKRDINELSTENLKQKYGLKKVDIMVLFGGSILQGGDILANAMKNNIAEKYVIVGGYGHTSFTLFEKAEREIPNITQSINSEAELFSKYIEIKYQLSPDFLEIKSTNCGNNITNLLALITKNNLNSESILLVQDATMQLRMDATLKKYLSKDTTIINFASYQVKMLYNNNTLQYNSDIHGLWDIDRYISLLMGEIPRLKDTPEGYGPNGKKFISHVDIPEKVMNAYEELKIVFPDSIRKANPSFASK